MTIDPNSDTMPASSADGAQQVISVGLPTTIGRFEIKSKLGQGGMGVVLLAVDPLLDRPVAIKILRGNGRDDTTRQRLLREAQSTAKLAHENLIVVHEVGTHDGRDYVAMEYVPGDTLRRWQTRRGWREVLEMYLRAGRGLVAAHEAGLVHRDFKPDNVLVGSDGRLRVTDFGLVATAGDRSDGDVDVDSKLTQTGAVLGTPRYMAPEQHLGEPVDARADQFAFCVALYEGLYGVSPFAGSSYQQLSANVIAGKLIPPPSSDVPAEIRDAVLQGLEREPGDRHRSMRDLLSRLVAPPPRRTIPAAAGVVGAGLLALVVLGVALRSSGEPPRSTTTAPGVRSDEPLTPRPAVELTTSQLDLAAAKLAQPKFDQGQVDFYGGDYAAAAQSFADAYAILPIPQLLYDHAASLFMKAKHDGDVPSYRAAADAYARYLGADPMAPGVANAIAAIDLEIARLESGGDRETPTLEVTQLSPKLLGFTLVMSTPPGATVYVDDLAAGPRGVTPWSGTLDGEHTIYIAKPGYIRIQKTNQYHREKMMVLSLFLAPGTRLDEVKD